MWESVSGGFLIGYKFCVFLLSMPMILDFIASQKIGAADKNKEKDVDYLSSIEVIFHTDSPVPRGSFKLVCLSYYASTVSL